MQEGKARRFVPGVRTPVSFHGEEVVRASPYSSEAGAFPLLVQPALPGVDLAGWGERNRGWVEEQLHRWGALLFRGFGPAAPEEFERVITALSGHTIAYRERSSPREHLSGGIYTSTGYPADQEIFPHNENSYAHIWPLRIFFCCITPPSDGGATPLVDCRRLLARIPDAIKERFASEGVLYRRNFSEWLGMPWRRAFQSDDRQQLEEALTQAGYRIQWLGPDRLRTERTGPAIVRHPHTGESVWFNHAAFFHISTLPSRLQADLRAQCAEEDLPANVYYGTGETIPPAVMEILRDAYRQEMVRFVWQAGDILMLDNMLVAHGRDSYTGQRNIVVGMTQPFNLRDGEVGTAEGSTL